MKSPLETLHRLQFIRQVHHRTHFNRQEIGPMNATCVHPTNTVHTTTDRSLP
ncbi:MAG: hypothetical protein NTW21_13865 [Verrucomicrobia bacterium]|nr:hypothetical protein [Verrucomicrobiota bacterium]